MNKALEEYKAILQRNIMDGDEILLPPTLFPRPNASLDSPSFFKGIVLVTDDGYYLSEMGQIADPISLNTLEAKLANYRKEKQVQEKIWLQVEIEKYVAKNDLIDLLMMLKANEVYPVII